MSKFEIIMIYIDPPYNTGNDFVYKDNYKDSLANYKNIVSSTGKSNPETSGRFHTDWLNMMFPRLMLAHTLLKDDGVIFISIDDNEVDNLKKMCNEIFGENNFIACLPTIMNLKGNNDEFGFAGTHEYTLIYAKIKEKCLINEFIVDEEDILQWEKDEIGLYKKGANLKATGNNAPREKRPNLFFPIYVLNKDNVVKWDLEKFDSNCLEIYPITDGKEMSWRWKKEKFINEKDNVILNIDSNNVSFYKKQRPNLGEIPSKKPKTTFYKPEYSSGNGTSELKKIFDNTKPFEFPKPITLIKDFLHLGISKNDDIILDLFWWVSCHNNDTGK